MNRPSGLISEELLAKAELHLSCRLKPIRKLSGGDEARVYLLESPTRSVVLHVSPKWRRSAELKWVHEIAIRVNRSIKEAIVPIDGKSGNVFEWGGNCAVAYPFVEGEKLDRDDPDLRTEAARFLAGIHKALFTWIPEERPESGPERPVIPPDVPDLVDDELDEWWESENRKGLTMGVTHGDYYRGNIICFNGSIKGIIDWHEAIYRPLAVELAGAAYELCRNDEYELDASKVREFVRTYIANGGPIDDNEIKMLMSFMRYWIREDARMSFSELAGLENEYAHRQVQNFVSLRNMRIDI